jgi:hypothetical protein
MLAAGHIVNLPEPDSRLLARKSSSIRPWMVWADDPWSGFEDQDSFRLRPVHARDCWKILQSQKRSGIIS